MDITSSRNKPCILSGIINDSTPPATPQHTIHIGIYVNNFVFFSESDTEESCFKKLLNNKVTTDFMGYAEFFLGSSFECNWHSDGKLSVHVSQQAFADNTDS